MKEDHKIILAVVGGYLFLKELRKGITGTAGAVADVVKSVLMDEGQKISAPLKEIIAIEEARKPRVIDCKQFGPDFIQDPKDPLGCIKTQRAPPVTTPPPIGGGPYTPAPGVPTTPEVWKTQDPFLCRRIAGGGLECMLQSLILKDPVISGLNWRTGPPYD